MLMLASTIMSLATTPFFRIHAKEILNNMVMMCIQVMIWNLAFKLEPSINLEFEVLSNQHPVLCD